MISKGYEECFDKITNEVLPQCVNLMHFKHALDSCRQLEDMSKSFKTHSKMGTYGYGYGFQSDGKLGWGMCFRIV